MAIAVFRAYLDRAIPSIKALEARAGGVDANTTETAVIDACCGVAITACEAWAAQACALLAQTIARAITRTTNHTAVITNVAFNTLAFEAGTILLRGIACTMATAFIRTLLGGAVMTAESFVALAHTIHTITGIRA